MLTKSRYVILSDRTYETADGKRCRLVYNTATAKVSLLGAEAARLLAEEEASRLPPQLAEKFRDMGLLTELTPSEEAQQVVARQRRSAEDLSNRVFVLLPASYCNMGCDYCGQTHRRGGLSAAHRAAVVDRVLAAMEAEGTERTEVRWFGGEPMMAFAVLRAMSKAFIETARSTAKPYRATITTNGVLLTLRKMHVLYEQCHVREVCITLDGPADTHDAHRPLKSGGRSFARIMKTLQDIVGAAALFPDLTLILRVNVDVRNRDEVQELIRELAFAGMNHPMVRLDLHGIYAWSNDVSAVKLDQAELARREVGWISYAIDHGLDHAVLPRRQATRICPAVSRAEEVISSTGSVFSCTEHPLVDRHEANDALANVVTLPLPSLRPPGQFDAWHERIDGGEVPCTNCVLLPVCGGACPKHWDEADPPCPPLKTNLQGRMEIVAALNNLNPIDRPPASSISESAPR